MLPRLCSLKSVGFLHLSATEPNFNITSYTPHCTPSNPSQPNPTHPPNSPLKPQTMDPPYLNIPKPTYNPNPPPRPQQQPPYNDNDDLEQQNASNTPGLKTNLNSPNSVRTRVFSGLLMLSVIALVVIILVVTSGHHGRVGRGSAVRVGKGGKGGRGH